MVKRQRVLVADSSQYFELPLWHMLIPEPEFKIVGVAKNIAEVVDMTQIHTPNIILIDSSASKMGGLWTIKRLRDIVPNTTIITITSLWSKQYAQAATQAGAAGCLSKSEIANGLLQTLRKLPAPHLSLANIY